ncbi:MAG: FAD-dependent thymidylate synthase [Herpetosiphon sp.]
MKIEVLDHGAVELLDSMGSDLTTVEAARVSFNRETTSMGEREQKLIRYLAEHEHTSPFRHAMLMLRFKAPLLVARQLWKHIVGISPEFDLEDRFSGFGGGYRDTGWNEVSGRYVELEEQFYVPATWRAQSASNKQGSAGSAGDQAAAAAAYRAGLDASYAAYQQLRELGVAKEQARAVLPQSIYTSWIWTGSLQAFLHVVDLRTKPDAQWETQQYGQAVRSILAERFPVCLEKWDNRKH